MCLAALTSLKCRKLIHLLILDMCFENIELSGVVRVMRNSIYHIQTTRSWDFLGLYTYSVNNLLHESKMGDGVIIGVLDSGMCGCALSSFHSHRSKYKSVFDITCHTH